MYKFILVLLALSMFAAAPGAAAADVRYPDNPYVGRNDIFVSFDGVHAYAVDSLQKQWSALPGEHTFEPVAYRHHLLVGSSRGLYALHTSDGSVLWHVESDNEIFTPLIVNGVAYAGSRNGTLYAFDATSGREQWRTSFPGWVYSPAFVGDKLIAGGQDATLWALDPFSGKQLWSGELPGELVYRAVPGSPTTVLATTFAADLVAYDLTNGTQQWRLQTPTANLTPTVSGNQVILAGFDGGLRKISLDSGTIEWERHLRGRLSPPRLFGDDYVIVNNDDGEVFMLRSEDGTSVGEARFDGEPVGAPFIRRGNVSQFFQSSGQLSIVASAEFSVVYETGE